MDFGSGNFSVWCFYLQVFLKKIIKCIKFLQRQILFLVIGLSEPPWAPWTFYLLLRQSLTVAQAVLESLILLTEPSECWDSIVSPVCRPPCRRSWMVGPPLTSRRWQRQQHSWRSAVWCFLPGISAPIWSCQPPGLESAPPSPVRVPWGQGHYILGDWLAGHFHVSGEVKHHHDAPNGPQDITPTWPSTPWRGHAGLQPCRVYTSTSARSTLPLSNMNHLNPAGLGPHATSMSLYFIWCPHGSIEHVLFQVYMQRLSPWETMFMIWCLSFANAELGFKSRSGSISQCRPHS